MLVSGRVTIVKNGSNVSKLLGSHCHLTVPSIMVQWKMTEAIVKETIVLQGALLSHDDWRKSSLTAGKPLKTATTLCGAPLLFLSGT